MCIRDSVSGEVVAFGDALQRDVVSRFGAHVEERQAGFAQPVSYTHLRAHETVLDLVCRLLLDKKKNTKTMHVSCDTTEQ